MCLPLCLLRVDAAHVDLEGNKWHGKNSAAFYFTYVKESDGYKLKRTRIFADATPALRVMLQNGILNGEQIAGMLKGA